MKFTPKLKMLCKIFRKTSNAAYKILPQKIQPCLQNKNGHRKKKNRYLCNFHCNRENLFTNLAVDSASVSILFSYREV